MLARLLWLRFKLVGSIVVTRVILWYAGVARLAEDGRAVIGFYSRYPALWRNAFGEAPVERYFSHVQQPLAAKTRVAFFVWLSELPELWRRRRTLRASLERLRISPLVSYLRVSDLAAVLFDTSLVRAYVHYHRRMARSVDVRFLRWNVSALWDIELRRNLTGMEIPRNMLMFFGARGFSARLELSALINPMEFQPMERAIWAGAAPNTVCVGVQHAAYCRNFLMYFFGRNELDTYIRERVEDASPLPDYFVASGVLSYDDMQNGGVPANKIELCGTVRYNDLRFEERADKSGAGTAEQSRRREVLVLTSQLRDESLDLIALVAQAAAQCGDGFAFAFKSHYHCVLVREIEREFAERAPTAEYRVLDVHGSVHDFIRDADIVVVGATGAAVEVLVLGHVPLVYVEAAALPLCPLTDFERAYRPFSSADGLSKELIGSMPQFEEVRAARQRVVEGLFLKLDGKADARFVEFLERVGAV